MISKYTLFIFLMLSLFCSLDAKAQGGRVEGYLYSMDSLPLVDIPVTLQNGAYATETNDKGFFRLDNIPAGAYKITFKFSADESESRKVQVIPDFTTTLKLYLPYKGYVMDEILILPANPPLAEVERMPESKNNIIYAGKKNEVIVLDRINANTAVNVTRQVFAKVPGATIWENDGSGIQQGIATRGLSPNRSWEFNVRQNGYDISADPFGYPEAYYAPPMEAVERIEVVRGAASLQYGPQFGGMLNYVTKRGNPAKKFSVESQQTVGSYGLFNSFNAIGGQIGKLNYYSYINYRRANGWRENSNYTGVWGYAGLEYKHRKLTLGAQISGQSFTNQQPGGLSEAMWQTNHRLSNRNRNWFSVPWVVPNVNMDYAFSQQTNLSVKAFGLFGERNSVGFVQQPTALDTPATRFPNRQVDRDFYKNFGTEARLSHKYGIVGKNKKHVFALGGRYFSGNTHRQQQGIGNNSLDYDLTLIDPTYGRDLEFQTTNISIFAENSFQLFRGFKVIPGIRYEYISAKADGYYGINRATGMRLDYNPDARNRSIILMGSGLEWQIVKWLQLYGNYAQGYRPIMFSELTPSATTDLIDPDLKDATGFNVDLGLRGAYKKFINYDVSYFRLDYDNRIANVLRGEDANTFNYRTNSPGSRATGVEAYLEVNVFGLCKNYKQTSLSIFGSGAIMEAKYQSGTVGKTDLEGKRVEYAPQQVLRAGLTFEYKTFGITYQFSHVGDVFSDATNIEEPTANGLFGKIPSYDLMDVSLSYRFAGYFNVRGGINNLADRKYFTRRAGGYPGPGIVPSEGRTFYLSLGIKF